MSRTEQDFLGLGSEARFNTPGVPSGNWRWRYRSEALDRAFGSAAYLKELGTLTGRV